MDAYLRQFREMVSLRGLTDHTVTSYSTYVRVYLDYLSDILHKMPEEVSWGELRDFVRWLQKARGAFRPHHKLLRLPTTLFYNLRPAQAVGSHAAPLEEV